MKTVYIWFLGQFYAPKSQTYSVASAHAAIGFQVEIQIIFCSVNRGGISGDNCLLKFYYNGQKICSLTLISLVLTYLQVEKNKFFLVNLNADPSLNELLVYYLKERTLVGRPEAAIQPDIQLMGLGIQVAAYTHFHKLTRVRSQVVAFICKKLSYFCVCSRLWLYKTFLPKKVFILQLENIS